MVYDYRLRNQWSAETFLKTTAAYVTVLTEERTDEGFEGKYVDPVYIRKCVLENVLEHAYPAGVA